ncbi:hypothetical protein GYA54_04680 [Candidatus Kuenenbacteria bacterium]|nr:hypothetical protein [Candidatus Kuenenbacteria bacterium]
MSFSLQNPRAKMYLSIALTMAAIFAVWVVTLTRTLKKPPTQKSSNISSDLKPLEEKLSVLFQDLQTLKTALDQSATTTATSLQGGPQIKPEELDKIIERLDISTSTTTSTPTTTKLIK